MNIVFLQALAFPQGIWDIEYLKEGVEQFGYRVGVGLVSSLPYEQGLQANSAAC